MHIATDMKREPTLQAPAFQLLPAIPVLRIFSEQKAREFYLDFLGFSVDWQHRFAEDAPLYLQISQSGLILHLSEHYGDATPGSTVFARVQEIDIFHRALTDRDYPYARPDIQELAWGRQMEIADPFGNRLRFCEQT